MGVEKQNEGKNKEADVSKKVVGDITSGTIAHLLDLAEEVNEVAVANLNKDQLLDYLDTASREGNLERLKAKPILVRAEYLSLKAQFGDNAETIYKNAKGNYKKQRDEINKMRTDGVPFKTICNKLISFQGYYQEDSSFTLKLLAEGKGNCEARAKLMIMLLEDVFGSEVSIHVDLVNIQDRTTKKLTPHVRVAVTYKKETYMLELPEVRLAPLRSIGKGTPALFTMGYLIKEHPASLSLQAAAPSPEDFNHGTTDSIFQLPKAEKIEQGSDQNISSADIGILKLQKLMKSYGYELKKNQSSTNESSESEKIADFSFLTKLDDPDIAKEIVRYANTIQAKSLYLNGLNSITRECAEILDDYNIAGWIYLGNNRTGIHLTPESVRGIQVIDTSFNRGLYLYVDAKSLSQEVAQAIVLYRYTTVNEEVESTSVRIDYGGFYLNVIGELTPVAAAGLGAMSGLDLSLTEKMSPEALDQLLGHMSGSLSISSEKGLEQEFLEKSFHALYARGEQFDTYAQRQKLNPGEWDSETASLELHDYRGDIVSAIHFLKSQSADRSLEINISSADGSEKLH